MKWRVGRKLGRTLYRGDQVVGMVDTPELAADIVAAMNGSDAQELIRLRGRLERDLESFESIIDSLSRDFKDGAWSVACCTKSVLEGEIEKMKKRARAALKRSEE
jgi:hypothetical protein